MARFFDKVGYELPGSNVDGVWSVNMTERAYYGDVLEATRVLSPTDKVHDDILLRNRISIMADAFAYENFSVMKYIWWNGTKWAVDTVAIDRPRLVLTLGGVWNGKAAPSSI